MNYKSSNLQDKTIFQHKLENIEQQKEKVKAQLQASEHLFQALLKQRF